MSNQTIPPQGPPGTVWRKGSWVQPGPGFDPDQPYDWNEDDWESANSHPDPRTNSQPQVAQRHEPEYYPQIELKLSKKMMRRMQVQSHVAPMTLTRRMVTMPLTRIVAYGALALFVTGTASAISDDFVIGKAIDGLQVLTADKEKTPQQYTVVTGAAEGNAPAPQP